LQLEDIVESAVEAVGPEMRVSFGLDQLRGDAHPPAGLANRTFEDIAHPQLAPDLLHFDGLALVGEARITGDHEQPADARKYRRDFLDHAVGEILLIGIAAHVLEWEDGDRRLVGEGQGSRRQGATLTRLALEALGTLSRNAGEGGPRRVGVGMGEGRANPVDPHRPGNVFDLLLAQILKDKGEPVAHVIMNRTGDEDPAGIGQGFDPRGDVDPVAIEVVRLDDDVAEVNADAQFDAVVVRDAGVPLGHGLLHRDCAAHRIEDARKFDQHAVAGGLDDAAVMLGDLRIEELAAQRLEALVRAFLVRPHQPRIARHIGGKDRGEAAGLAHVFSSAAKRRPDRNSSRSAGLRNCAALGRI